MTNGHTPYLADVCCGLLRRLRQSATSSPLKKSVPCATAVSAVRETSPLANFGTADTAVAHILKRPLVEPNVMNNTARDEMMAAQAKLDETLKKHSPFVFDELAPPATEGEIGQLRAACGGAEQPFLELWFKWHNGCKTHPIGLLPLGELLSINESISDRTSIQSIHGVHARRKRDIKLLDDGCGDGFFLDLSTSVPRMYYEMLQDPFPEDFGTMLQFLQFIERVHTAEIASVNKRGIVVFDEPTYQNLEGEHLASVSKVP